VSIPAYHHLDRIRRRVWITIAFIYRYVLDKVRWSIRAGISAYRYVPDRMQSVRAGISGYRFVPDRVQGVRTAISAYRFVLDRMQSVRTGISGYRFVPDSLPNIRSGISGYRFVPDRLQGARAANSAYRFVLDRIQGVRTAISAYRFVPDSLQNVRAGISGYRFVPHSLQNVRAVISDYRYVPDRLQGVRAGISDYRFVPDRMQNVRAVISDYRYVPNSLHGVQAANSAYRFVLDRIRRRVRTATAFVYRYVLDRVDRDVRVTFSFPSFRFAVTGATALAILALLSLLLYQSFLTAPVSASNAQVGINAYHFVFADKDFGIAFGTTLVLGIGMTLIAVPLGAVLAFVMVRTDIPGRLWIEPLILLLICIPALVLAFGYVAALGPAGILTIAYKEWAGAVPWNVYSFAFFVAIAGLTHVPHVYLCVAPALRALSSEAEEAACSAGAKRWRVAFDVSLPMTTPAILFAGALVFLLGLQLFGLPFVLGDPQGRLVLSTYLYKLGNGLAVSPYQLMAVVAVIIALTALPLAIILRALLGEVQGRLAVRSRSPRRKSLKLGWWRWPVFLVIVLWLTVTVLVPLAAITVQSFVETGGQGIARPQALTFDHYRALLEHADVTRSIMNTVAIGLAGSAAAFVVYTAIALAIHRWRSAWARAVDYLVMVPCAMTGLVAGLVLLLLFSLFKPLRPLPETLIPLWIAYTLVWVAFGVQLVSGIFRQVDPQLEDIARTIGASGDRVRFDITLPLIRDGLLAGWLILFVIFVREYLPGVYLLAPGTEVMGSLLVSLWGKGAIDLVSALSVVNVGVIGTALVIANRLGVRLHG
jgi:iron(III) transport system permease protein